MLPHWDSAIRPFVLAIGTGPIVEIGSATGETTAKLAEIAAERGFTLHSIDPAPEFDVSAMERRYDGRFVFHEERSHDALGRIEAPSLVLIDGDHNWYTVHGELTRLAGMAEAADRPFPLVVVHDVEWPYARRDMYYDPAAIPARWRKPWERRGIRLEKPRLDATGKGINAHLANAIEEGGPRNGVLTAVEDFMEDSEASFELLIVRGAAGLGFLASEESIAARPAIRREWERLRSPDFLLAHMEALSRNLTKLMVPHVEAAQRSDVT